MAREVITLSHTDPPFQIIFDNRFEEALKEIDDLLKRRLAAAGQQIVLEARSSGDYENRVGNLRRMITSNFEHAYDDVKTYPKTMVSVEDADGKTRNRPRFTPPADFDKTKVEDRADGFYITIASIMWYAAALEAHGYNVLSHVFDKLLAGEGLEMMVRDLTDWKTKFQRETVEAFPDAS